MVTFQSPGTAGQKGQDLKLYSKSFALVIGNDRYPDKGWRPLREAVKDATAVAEALEKHGFTVTLRKDLGSEALKSELQNFLIRTGRDPEARLFIWFAGHGHTTISRMSLPPASGTTRRSRSIAASLWRGTIFGRSAPTSATAI